MAVGKSVISPYRRQRAAASLQLATCALLQLNASSQLAAKAPKQ
jgi:hypothetical protein